MLFSDRGGARRVHGCYVDEDEIQRVVEFLKTQGRPVYNLDIVKPRDEEDGEGGGGLPAATSRRRHVRQGRVHRDETRNASISLVQRQLRIGYNRAARLVERMERDGIVGAPNGSKPREVLAQAI